MYVAGSHTARDWYDDVSKIPFWGDVRNSERYQQADKMLTANPQVHTLVGHSLGGSVVHQLQTDHPGLRTVTYGAPSISWQSGGERYRNAWDPFSSLDRGAVQETHPHPFSTKSLTHDYHSFENTSSTDGRAGQENPDGSVSITE
jgi:pimeloyl-ACP methyl ester carboxylesterase